MKATAIATMTLARDDREAGELWQSLETISRIGLPVFAADAGSVACFKKRSLSIPRLELWEEGATLVQQIRACFRRILTTDHRTILYSEPDKKHFFEGRVRGFLASAETWETAAVCVAARDEPAFATFPPAQQAAERVFNDLAKRLLGLNTDLLYGPLILDLTVAAPFLEHVPDSLGWGWRPYVIARCILAGKQVIPLAGAFECEAGQQMENSKDIEYRLLQLQQNVEGLRLALKHATSGGCSPDLRSIAQRLP